MRLLMDKIIVYFCFHCTWRLLPAKFSWPAMPLISLQLKNMLCFSKENSSNNLDFSYYNGYTLFNLGSQSEAKWRANFSGEKHHIPLVEDAFQIPQYFVCDQETVCEGTEGLCMILKRYSFPCRYSDMIPIFGTPVPAFCMICYTVTDSVWLRLSGFTHIMIIATESRNGTQPF